MEIQVVQRRSSFMRQSRFRYVFSGPISEFPRLDSTMEALIASYGDVSSDSDSETSLPTTRTSTTTTTKSLELTLPPPPLSLLSPPNSTSALEYDFQTGQPTRTRSFPHVEGNYALHVYIPVYIPPNAKREMTHFLKRISHLVPGLHVVDADIPFNVLCKNDHKLDQVGLGREFHISLGRTVPIRVHQIDSIVTKLRQKPLLQKRYWIDFTKWEVFVNDDRTRTFLSLEVVTAGLAEITKQIQCVNEVYKLHSLPEFYKDPRPHISVAWALGDVSDSLKRAVEEEMNRSSNRGSVQKRVFTCKFSSIDCKIGNKMYKIGRSLDE